MNNHDSTFDLLNVNAYDYQLPDELIARHPLSVRSASRLLYLPDNQPPQDKLFAQLPELLCDDDLVVFNDTKVMKARLYGLKDSGGRVEVLVERLVHEPSKTHQHHVALCHVRASRAAKVGQTLHLADGHMQAEVLGRVENLFKLAFTKPILPDLDKYGEMPIPPYFERPANDNDDTRYQTVFHDPHKQASVAAPTASLHFDADILKRLQQMGVKTAFVTLHVGAGTFAPIKTTNILNHTMHSEFAHLPQQTAQLINTAKAQGSRVIAVGTTVTRVLETAYQQMHKNNANQLATWSGDTDIFIYPGFEFGVVDGLITNFHLPKSTLLMLVAAFAGKSNIDAAYAHAIAQRYRFFSYGDAMFLQKRSR